MRLIARHIEGNVINIEVDRIEERDKAVVAYCKGELRGMFALDAFEYIYTNEKRDN